MLAAAVGRVGDERAHRAGQHVVEADAEALARLVVEQQADAAVAGRSPEALSIGIRHADIGDDAVDARLAVDRRPRRA